MIWTFGAKQFIPLVREVIEEGGEEREQVGRLEPGHF